MPERILCSHSSSCVNTAWKWKYLLRCCHKTQWKQGRTLAQSLKASEKFQLWDASGYWLLSSHRGRPKCFTWKIWVQTGSFPLKVLRARHSVPTWCCLADLWGSSKMKIKKSLQGSVKCLITSIRKQNPRWQINKLTAAYKIIMSSWSNCALIWSYENGFWKVNNHISWML